MEDGPQFFDLDALNGPEFEEAMDELFRRLGYEVETTDEDAEDGRDLIVSRKASRTIVGCQNQHSPVDRPVIQQFHSVLVSDRETTHGIVINPGGFSEKARAKAREITEQGDSHVELWGLEELESRGKEAGVYFHCWALETYEFFHVPWNEEEDVADVFVSHYLKALESHPREAADALEIPECDRTYHPAIQVEYTVDKRFTVSSREIHHVQETGTRIFSVSGHSIDEDVQRFIVGSTLRRLGETKLQGDSPVSFFRGDLNRYRDRVADQVSRDLTTEVEYTGQNDQTYTHLCEVNTSDVEIEARQLFVAQNALVFEVGPRDYSVEALDSKGADWQFRDASSGFVYGDDGLRERNGFLCNDCGLIVPESEGASCAECDRTLCPDHRWRWPTKFPRSWSRLCASCYGERDPEAAKLTAGPLDRMPYLLALLGLIPGLSFLVGKRPLGSAVLILLTLLVEGGILFWPPLADLAARHYFLLLPVGISLVASIYWLGRLMAYRAGVEELEDYTPEWT